MFKLGWLGNWAGVSDGKGTSDTDLPAVLRTMKMPIEDVLGIEWRPSADIWSDMLGCLKAAWRIGRLRTLLYLIGHAWLLYSSMTYWPTAVLFSRSFIWSYVDRSNCYWQNLSPATFDYCVQYDGGKASHSSLVTQVVAAELLRCFGCFE